MANCFVSFLGTSDYTRCNYLLDGRRVDGVRFVQSALLELLAGGFDAGAGDRILIGCTEAAAKENFPALRDELRARGWQGAPLDKVDLPDATTEADMWTIFETLNAHIGEGDRLLFDITHSFRSLPMLFTVLIQYLGVVKHTHLDGVYYGAFERLGSKDAVKNMPEAERDAPIIELTTFLKLFDWSNAIDQFLTTGRTEALHRQIDGHIAPILKSTRGRDDNAQALRGVANQLDEFATAVRFVRGAQLAELRFRSKIVEPLDPAKQSFIQPLQPVLEQLAERFSDWPDTEPENCLRAVQWCLDHDLIQQGLTLLQEGMIELLTQHWRAPLQPIGEGQDAARSAILRRQFLSGLLNVHGKPEAAAETTWRGPLGDHPEIAKALINRHTGELDTLAREFRNLTGARNDINHGGFDAGWRKPETLRACLQNSYETIRDLLGITP